MRSIEPTESTTPQEPSQEPSQEPERLAPGATPQPDHLAGLAGLGAPEAPSAPPRGGVRPVPWTFRQMVIGVVATLVPWFAFSLGALLINTGSAVPTKRLPIALDAVSGVLVFIVSALLEGAFLIAPLVIVFSRRLPAASVGERLRWLGFRATPLAPAVVVVIIGLVIGLGGSALYSAIISALHLPLQTNTDTLLQEGRTEPLTTLGILLAAALIAPVCEEVFFRGLLFTGLLKRMPLWSATLLSALIFAAAHVDLGSLIPLFLIGLALAWARWRSDSLWPGLVIHAANNSAAALLLLPYLLSVK